MEPTDPKVSRRPHCKILMGEFRVVQVKLDGITIDLGRKVHITIHVGDFPHSIREGDVLPLFTEIPYAIPGSASE